MELIIKYTFFAVIAAIANILCQEVTNRFYHGQYDLYLSMMSGTLVGLVVKYLLDKKYIFAFKSKNLLQDSQRFFIYSSMGIVTTFIF